MVASLRSLLDEVIDYAGLFPPAKLDMGRAVSNFVQYRQGQDAWMVGRFVCSSSRLGELNEVLATYARPLELPVTVVGQAGDTMDAWAAALEHDAEAMTVFVQDAGEAASVEAYEIKIPSHRNIETCVRDLKAFQEVDVFVELPWGAGIDDSLAALAETEWLCAKARTGGESAAAFPPPSELAEFLHEAVALELTFKLTAGLHHPFPRVDRETGARMHGFLNVLAACGFALAHDMSRSELEDVLISTSLEDWRFGEDKIALFDSTLTIEDIEDSRELLWSIGLCSVEEAIADLDVLGLVSGVR